MAKEAARAQREREAKSRREQRELDRHTAEVRREELRVAKENIRLSKEYQRAAKLEYIQSRETETQERNEDLSNRIRDLNNILYHALTVNDAINFDDLRLKDPAPTLSVPSEISNPEAIPERYAFFGHIAPPSALRSMIPGARKRYEQEIAAAEASYSRSLESWRHSEAKRSDKYTAECKQFEKRLEEYNRKKLMRDEEVEEFRDSYIRGESDSITSYIEMVLERSAYPEYFPQKFSLAFSDSSKLLVIEYEFPGLSVIPSETEFKFSKTKDEITSMNRKAADSKKMYADVISGVALRTIHEVFESDTANHIQVCCFNGFVKTVDLATGKDISPHVLSVRTSRSAFQEIDLQRVDKAVCLKNLGAAVSRSPAEAQAVKPVVEFNMVDPRFVSQSDLADRIDAATNLMDLTPSEFEHLVANLFGRLGLESKLTRSSRDGGVDCVAYDARPVLGGKVVIQAKRYRHTVGIAAVRDLYGTMMNEGANKGILVATSGYGSDAFDFSKDKPIELIDGGGLLHLLGEVGVRARIVMPED